MALKKSQSRDRGNIEHIMQNEDKQNKERNRDEQHEL